LRRAIELAAAAYNRRDLDAVVISYGPGFEYLPGQKWVDAGLVEPRYIGKDGYTAYVRATEEVWGEENIFRPFVAFDLGDRVVILADERMRAQASGVPLTEQFAYVTELGDGRIVRLQEYYDHAEALAAAGIAETPEPATG
jgi:ketosteroid isomerase-like protein